MMPQALRKLYYQLMWVPMKCNGVVYKVFRAPKKGIVKVHRTPHTLIIEAVKN